MRKKSRPFAVCWTIAFMVLVLVNTSGCTKIQNYYPVVPHPKLSAITTPLNGNKPSVALQFEFQNNGIPIQSVTQKWSPHVHAVIEKTGVFSLVNNFGMPSDCSLRVIMNNIIDSLAGAYAQGFLSGLTLGFIGTKVTDNYVCTATLIQKTSKPLTKEYRYMLTSTSGLITSGVDGVTPHKTLDSAFGEMLDQFLFKCLFDLQKEGGLCWQ